MYISVESYIFSLYIGVYFRRRYSNVRLQRIVSVFFFFFFWAKALREDAGELTNSVTVTSRAYNIAPDERTSFR
jgi:hypothetical protein